MGGLVQLRLFASLWGIYTTVWQTHVAMEYHHFY
jgi:hypothetical protein